MPNPVVPAKFAASSPVGSEQRSVRIWIITGLVVAGTIAHIAGLQGAFVFDDQGAILDNRTIRRLGSWDVLAPPVTGMPVTGRPLLNLTFALNHAIHGDDPVGYHVVNGLIHLLGAITLFSILQRTLALYCNDRYAEGRSASIAAATALLWVVHPLQTGAVTYISQRAESLASLFILVALYAFARATASSHSRAWLAASALACWLGVATKEICVVIPILVLSYARLFVHDSWRGVLRSRRLYFATLLASWLPLWWLVHSTDNRGATWGADSGFTPWEYLQIQCEALVHYLRLVVWPSPLVFDYGRNLPVPTWSQVLPHGLFLLTSFGATVFGLWRRSRAAFLGVCFFGVLAPSSSVAPLADPVFEYRMYLPSAAVLAGLVMIAGRFCPRRLWWGVVPVALVLTVLTIDRNRDFRSAEHLWQDTVEKRPTNARAHGNLGTELMRQRRHQEALSHFEKAYALTPRAPAAPHNLAVALDLLGRRDEAIARYREALEFAPKNVLARTNLANALAQQGALDEALAHYQRVLHDEPDFADGHRGYARALLRAQRTAEAIGHFRRETQLRPHDPEAHFNLGDALARSRRFSEAVPAFREAVRLHPGHTAALNNLGNALLVSREIPEAIKVFEHSLHVHPDPVTHTNLGLALLLSRRRADAVVQFEAALRLAPDYSPARAGLEKAAALAPTAP